MQETYRTLYVTYVKFGSLT